MIQRRQRYDEMEPINAPTWLVQQDVVGSILRESIELPPLADPIVAMIRSLARSVDEGWTVEGLPGSMSVYFMRNARERRMVAIVRVNPAQPAIGHAVHATKPRP